MTTFVDGFYIISVPFLDDPLLIAGLTVLGLVAGLRLILRLIPFVGL